MARPLKEGLNYFPLDVELDDKFELVEAEHGLIGFAITIKLLQKIYKEGYYYKWTEREQLLFARRINVDINSLSALINDCLKWDLFSQSLFEEYQILTSCGIQKRYIDAIKRRKEATFTKEYVLVSLDQLLNKDNFNLQIVNANNNAVNVDINPVNDDIGTQSKVKESKENNYTPEFEEFWNECIRKEDKKPTFKKYKTLVNKGTLPSLLKQAAINYAADCRRRGTQLEYIKKPRNWLESWDEWLTVEPQELTIEQTEELKTKLATLRTDLLLYGDNPKAKAEIEAEIAKIEAQL